MALRARLSPPRAEPGHWPWHQAKWGSLSAKLLYSGDRRMEADNFLAGGYGIRLAMEIRKAGWTHLGALARVWQPSRLKGIQVSREFGTPFLAATQVFDLRPVPRKFLALEKVKQAGELFVTNGQILVTRSGSVGRATLAHAPHEKTIISDDLLRVEPRQDKLWGWLYAYLRAPQTRAMMSAAQYGHIIKHLEVGHLNALPMPVLRDALLDKFQVEVTRILELRRRSYGLMIEAENCYAATFSSIETSEDTVLGFSVQAEEIFRGRRRLDSGCFAPSVTSLAAAFTRHAHEVVPLSSLVERVFVPGRFKHVYGDGGVPYLDSADILEVSPEVSKFVLSLSSIEQKDYQVEAGWLLVPCSGQVYGNIGHTVLATEWHVNKVLTNHILRICPTEKAHSGYLRCVLGHPRLGRPQIVRFAFGSSVPEIAAEDIATMPVPRLDLALEKELSDMMEESARMHSEADLQEDLICADAETILDRFIAGDTQDVVVSP